MLSARRKADFAVDFIDSPPPPANAAPTAVAGDDRTVNIGEMVVLFGRGTDPEGDALSYAWTQTGGTPTATLTGADTATARFTAPAVAATLTFTLTVTDSAGNTGTDTVTVNVLPDITAPRLTAATVNVGTVTLTFDEALDESSVPGRNAFRLRVAGFTRSPSSVSVSGSTVTLTLTRAVAAGSTVTVTYDRSLTAARLRDLAGNEAGTLNNRAVTNARPGVLLSAAAFTLAEGGSGTYTVRLAARPSASVTVAITSDNDDVTVDDTDGDTTGVQNALSFTTGNWSTAQTVTVRAAEDADSTDDSATLTHALSGASEYDGLADPTVSVTVTDKDAANSAPVFGETSYGFTLAENADGGTTAVAVGTVSATDADTGDEVSYGIHAGDDGGVFAIDASTGAIAYTGTGENHEATPEIELTVRASDGAADTDVTVTVTVTDVNGEAPGAPAAPTFGTATSTSLAVNWLAPANAGPAIADYDVQYRQGTSGDWTALAHDSADTTATLTGLTPGASYQVQVRATSDEGTGDWSDSGTGTTGANNAPAFGALSYNFTLAENADGGTTAVALGTVLATDADTGHMVTYSIAAGNPGGVFAIASDGAITYTGSGENFESFADPVNAFALTVRASDGEGASADVTATVEVSDDNTEAPGVPAAPAFGTATSTSLVVNWLAPDNAGPAITDYDVRYRRSGVTAWTSHAFTGTGLTTTLTGLTPGASYQVQVRAASDEGTGGWSPSGTGTTGANNAPAFDATSYSFTLAENEDGRTTAVAVGTVLATDTDAGHTVTYSIAAGNTGNVFAIDSSSGAITYTGSGEDRGTTPRFTLTVRASDGAGASADVTVIVAVTDALTLSSATVSGTTLTLTYNKALDTGSVPGLSAFTVRVNGHVPVWASTNPVAISGSAVTLTLASAVGAGARVEVRYNPLSTATRIRDLAGNEAAGISRQTVTNDSPDTTAPTLSSATVDETTLTLIYNEALDTGSVPGPGAFPVTVGGVPVTVNTVDVSGSAVTLTLATAPAPGQAVTVAYTVPTGAGANPIRDLAHNNAETFAAMTAVNATPGIVLSASALTVAEGGTATYTARLGSAPTGTVTVTVASNNTDVTFDTDGDTANDQSTLSFTTANWSTAQTVRVRGAEDDDTTDDSATLRHTAAGGGYGAYTADLAVTVSEDTGPTLVSATVNGASLTLTYDEPLDATSGPLGTAFTVTVAGSEVAVSGVTIGGSTVTLLLASAAAAGDAVTVAYTVPSSDPIRNAAGDAAASFGARTAINVTGDTTAPAVSTATVDGATLTLTWGEMLDAAHDPGTGAFTVEADGTDIDVTGVSISGSTVTLTLASAVAAGQTVTVAYTVPTRAGTSPIRDVAGNTAASFAARSVTNNRAGIVLSASALTVAEGGTATYTVRLGTRPSATVSVRVARSGSEDVGFDTRPEHGNQSTLSFSTSNWSTPQTVTVSAAEDSDTDDDSATLRHTAVGGGYDIHSASLEVTVTDDDAGTADAPVVTVSASETSIEEGAAVTLTFTATPAPTKDTEVYYEIEDGGAFGLHGSDRTVTIAAGETSATDVVQTTPDTADNTDATFTVELDYAVADDDGYTVGDADSVEVRVTQSNAPVVSVSAAPATITEGAAITLTFTADAAPSADLAVKYEISGGTAFGLPSFRDVQTATIAAGQTRVAVVHDTDPDDLATSPDNTVTFRIQGSVSPTGADYLASDPPSVRVTVRQDTTAPTLSSARATGATLTLTYDEPLDGTSVPAASAFAVAADDTGIAVTRVSVSGRAVTLTLASAVRTGQAVTVGYTAPATNRIRDAAGNDAGNLAGRAVTLGPAVKQVDIPAPEPGGAFGLGDTVEVQVLYNSRLTVTGAPRLALTVGSATRYATFSRRHSILTGIKDNGIVAFTYTVQLGDYDADGIAVAGPIELNGGSIGGKLRDDGSPVDLTGEAALSLGAHAAGAWPGVDARTSVTDIQISSEQPSGGTYGAGGTISVGIILDRTVWVSGGTPRLALEVGDETRQATYAGRNSFTAGTTTLTFDYTVQADDLDEDGIAITAGTIDLNDAELRDADGNALDLVLAYGAVPDDGGHKVDGATTAAAPAVTGLPAVTGPGDDGVYAARERIEARVRFTGPVTVDTAGGSPTLGLALGGVRREAAYEGGSETAELVFALTVPEAAAGAGAAKAVANGIRLNGATVRSADGIDAALAFGEAPGVVAVEIAAPAGGSWDADGAVTVTLAFAEPVEVVDTAGGTPSVGLDLTGAGARRAAYAGGSGTDRLAFSYTLVADDGAVSAVSVGADSLALNGGAIRSTGGLDAVLAHHGAGDAAVPGPADPGLSVADATVEEGPWAMLAFAVTLDRARDAAVTVDYATSDGTAVAWEDYVPESGTLTFAAGETSRTVQVEVLDDAHDEGAETMTLTLSNASGARIADGEAVGTIVNADPAQKAWIARFGRTVADQVIEAVDARIEAPRTAGSELTLGGQPVPLDGAADAGKDAEDAAAARDLAAWLHQAEDPEEKRRRELEMQGMGQRELLLGTSFSFAGGDKRSGHYALWGRGAVSRFDGREDDLTVDGEVASAFLGADWSRDRTTLGLILGHSVGDGGYASEAGSGTVSATLTGLYPWLRQALTDRVSVWGVAGYGEGTLTMTPANADGTQQAALRTDLSLAMGAVGLRGVLVEAPETGGFELAVKTDAMAVRTRSAAVTGAGGNLAAATAGVTRLRLGLEGSRPFRFEGGASLTPSLEVGVRLDGGDAETGAGLEVGGGLSWSDPARGLSVDLRGRGLLTHEDGGFRERGLSGSLVWDPAPDSDRGPSLTLSQTLGVSASDGGVDRLFREGAPAELVASGDGLDARSIQASFGYGFGVFGDRVTMTPEFDLGLSDTGRDYRLGWRLSRGSRAGETGPLELLLETTRREFANDNGAGTEPEHTVGFKIEASF